MWTVILIAIFSYSTNARVLYTYENDPKDPILRSSFNSTANDVTQWELEEGGMSPRQEVSLNPGQKTLAGMRTREQEPLEVVVSLLQSMHEEVTNLRGQMANVKYQNHLIYKQIKRINNRCSATPAPKVKTRVCPRNFVFDEESDKCYKFSRDRITWRMAREKCRNTGADLISISDVRTQQFVAAMSRKNKELRHCDYWIGANDMDREGQWRWASTGKSVAYANWNHNEPNNGSGDEHCAMMLWVFNWSWNDARCKYDNACYICETAVKED